MGTNNAAGRLLRIMERIEEQKRKGTKPQTDKEKMTVLSVWIEVLNVVNRQEDVYGRLKETQYLIDEVEAYADEVEPSGSRWRNLSSIRTLFRPTYLNHPISSIDLDGSHLFILDRFSREMPSEGDVPDSTIENLLSEIEELSKHVRKLDDLDKPLKKWTPELLSLIREAISKFMIYGGRGLKRELQSMAAMLQDRYKELEKKSPTVWQRVVVIMAQIRDVIVITNSAKTITVNMAKLIGYEIEDPQPD